MADRGAARGSRGSAARGGANTRGGPRGAHAGGNAAPRDIKAPILDLGKYLDKQIRVKFTGGREVTGLLKGYDQLFNLVMDQVVESERESETTMLPSRELGLVVVRGTALVVISPVDGLEEIANPFAQN